MPFEVLTASGADAAKWTAALPAGYDLHYSLAYAKVQAALGHRPRLAVWSGRGVNGIFVQPFLLRTGMVGPESVIDIGSMYGYGGPAPGFSRAMAREMEEWAWTQNIISEFAMLHPMLRNWPDDAPRSCKVDYLKDVVVIDMRKGEQDFLSKFSRRVRRGVADARKMGAQFCNVAPTKENIRIFADLYAKSMERLAAPQRFLFAPQYFEAHFTEFGPQAVMFFVKLNGGVERALLTLRDARTAYAHFLGSTGENRDCGLDDLMYASAAQEFFKLGCQFFHLGGGTTASPSDSLLAYKCSFSDMRLPVKTLRRIFDRDQYEHLCEVKRKLEIDRYGGALMTDFFPLYRREAA